jgi:hypothetical protein
MTTPAPVALDAIEAQLRDLIPSRCPPPAACGRPASLAAAVLWSGLLVCVLRKMTSQQALWRLLAQSGLWDFPRITVGPARTTRSRTASAPTVMQDLFTQVSAALAATVPPDETLAPFATGVYILDETTLDQVARTLPSLRAVPAGDDRLLPGKLQSVFDLRTHQFVTIQTTDLPRQNEKVAARDLVRTLPPQSLLLADLGYFAFPWFDELVDAGYHLISRLRDKTSYETVHVFTDQDGVRDELVWLGGYRADKAAHVQRLLTIQHGDTTHRYLTSVLDPATLPPDQVVDLYARRWSIEEAFSLVKQELGLHLLWSAQWEVILTQVYAVLLIAQIAKGLCAQIAAAAAIPVAQVSTRLLLRDLPYLVQRANGDLIGYVAALPVVKGGYLRPTRTVRYQVPRNLPVVPRPPDLVLWREPRYAHRRSTVVHTPLPRYQD